MFFQVLVVFFLFVIIIRSKPTIDRYVKFVRRLLFSPDNLKYSENIIFNKNHGEINRDEYEKMFGQNGELLVDAFGKGLTKKELENLGYL